MQKFTFNVCLDYVKLTFISGPYVARFCMDLAIEKAKTAGIGFVSCRGMCNVYTTMYAV